jgi:hypothetical protein
VELQRWKSRGLEERKTEDCRKEKQGTAGGKEKKPRTETERKTERDEKKKIGGRDTKKTRGQRETKQSTKQSKEKTPKEEKNQGATQRGVLVFAIVFVPAENPESTTNSQQAGLSIIFLVSKVTEKNEEETQTK